MFMGADHVHACLSIPLGQACVAPTPPPNQTMRSAGLCTACEVRLERAWLSSISAFLRSCIQQVYP